MKNSPEAADKDRLIKEYEAEKRKLQQENADLKSELRSIAYIDIAEQRKAEAALRQSQKLLQQIFNHMPLPIIVLRSKDLSVVEVNDTFLKRSCLSRTEVIDKEEHRFNDWQDPREFWKFMEIIKQEGQVKNFEIKSRLPSGEIRALLISAVIISWQDEECILVIGNDITEIKKLRNEMLRLDYLNLIRQLAAGIAHEIKNPMSTVRQFLQLFGSKEKYRADRKAFELIIEELDRVNDIIDTFSLLARQNNIDMKLQSLNDNIVNMFPAIMDEAVKNNVFIKLDLSDVAPVMIDQGEIWQLLLSLVRNGMDAMPNGGILTIRTFQDLKGINLVIKDKGHGIPEEIMEKIALPFFTTNDKRTGLGLAVCDSIAARHNAKIEIKTGPEGTAFYVIFPVPAAVINIPTSESAPA
jgi:PAS domain S-box-containing protein